MREQTDKKEFLVEEVLQAPDQEKLTADELEGLRQQYELDQEEKKLKNSKKPTRRSVNAKINCLIF